MNIAAQINYKELFEKIRQGDRIALSRAITLVESRQPEHIEVSGALLDACIRETEEARSIRLAVSGAPGVGKSTFIEAISKHILDADHTLAVLAIDPSSQVTGGSILGDKTRMHALSAHPKAFVRPSPAATHQGGVAERTREAIILCEAAGFDTILVETVGVGQSETHVRSMTDVLLLLIAPGGGDEVQGIKRGILELADIVVINKADGDLIKKARETLGQYTQALRVLFSDGEMPDVLSCSALTGDQIDAVWSIIRERIEALRSENRLQSLRKLQNLTWFEERLQKEILRTCMAQPDIAQAFRVNRQQIAEHGISVRTALREMRLTLDRILKKSAH